MRRPNRTKLLTAFDFILFLGASVTGYLMIRSNYGIFKEFPQEWVQRTPFSSWILPGILIFILFGLGNLFSALYCFISQSHRSAVLSSFMASMLLAAAILQIILLKECYLATIQVFTLGVLQLLLCGYVLMGTRKAV